jgi:hypothetical protein
MNSVNRGAEGLETDTTDTADKRLASEQAVGSNAEWKEYRKQFKLVVDEAVRAEIIPNRAYLDRVFKNVDESGTSVARENGNLWMVLEDQGKPFRLGLTADTILGGGSDPQLAYQVILARINSVLKSPSHSRETMVEFRESWSLLRQARELSLASLGAQWNPIPERTALNQQRVGQH